MRKAGILMPVASLPSRYGIGDFGNEAYEFVDIIKEMGVCVWQILPLGPLGYGNSPYQAYSSYAGDELYISLEKLKEEGLIKRTVKPFRALKKRIDYEAVRAYKESCLREAFKNFKEDEAYRKFCSMEWVYPYAVFLTLKKANHLICWNEWPKEQQDWIKDRKYDLTDRQEEIAYEMFVQYLFFCQWMKLKAYANENGIEIMGDLPIYVGIDSLDVWANQDCFLLDDKSRPTFIAGVPPDYFSETGQRWGNPIYDWNAVEETGFNFWTERLSYSSRLYDILRIDHFRAFDTYWKIPAACETAKDGEWVEAPGYALFDTILEELPDIRIVVEDLGDLRPEVLELRDYYGFSGMKVVQFTFDDNETNNDFPDRENMIIYTGTHDNQTVYGWYLTQTEEKRMAIKKFMKRKGYRRDHIAHQFIQYTLNSIAGLAVIPVQDMLCLDDDGRLNTPGTLGSPNWEWRMTDFEGLYAVAEEIRLMICRSGR